jgi:hypothetical protein
VVVSANWGVIAGEHFADNIGLDGYELKVGKKM